MEHTNKDTHASHNSLSESRFKILLLLLRTTGIRLNVKSKSAVHIIYSVILAVFIHVSILSLYVDTFVQRHQLVELMKKLRLLIATQIVTWMHFSLSYRKREVEHLIRLTDYFTWEELPTRDPDTGYLTKAGYLPFIQKLTKYATLFAIIYHCTQTTVRIILNHDMVFASWYPLEVSESPAYEIANITQAIQTILMIFLFIGFQSLYATFVCVACSQLEKLRAAILDIRQTYITPEQDCGAETNKKDGEGHPRTHEELFGHMQKQLNDCIRHHQKIKRYMEALENAMNLPMCGLFLICLSTMCFAAFSATLSWGDHVDVSQALIIYIMVSACVCQFCWLGNELSEEAENVRDAAWGCDWVGTPVPFQRCLIFIIAAANKEFTLTAGKFVPVSNKTMMNMMNQTLSFFMFLLQMKDKSTDTSQGA
ncbi:hypothetical protein L798_06229 [Zootermopsis nevadensis]|uniref:Odorant receptor n=1 Tax=Zootermopsis nevadensis TaxID=136037 RepID=A0A067R6W3_ZOONE|nr:hypothetical protein L798_06229 [Zootermopsis nevadensis]